MTHPSDTYQHVLQTSLQAKERVAKEGLNLEALRQCLVPMDWSRKFRHSLFRRAGNNFSAVAHDHPYVTWGELCRFTAEQAGAPGSKETAVSLSQHTQSGFRKEFHLTYSSDEYLDFDQDEVLPGDSHNKAPAITQALLELAGELRVAAIFSESASSVKARHKLGDEENQLEPTKWHYKFATTRSVAPWAGLVKSRDGGDFKQVEDNEEFEYYRLERKRKKQHLRLIAEGYLQYRNALDPDSHFDHTVCQLLQLEFLASRPAPDTNVTARILTPPGIKEGDPAFRIDLDAFCRLTGYVPGPTPAEERTAREAKKTITYTPPRSSTPQATGQPPVQRTVHLDGDDLFADVCRQLSPTELLAQHYGITPSGRGSGGEFYACPVHRESQNANPNYQSAHTVYRGDRWYLKCFGDCGRSYDTVHIHASLSGMGLLDAARDLAKRLGLDPEKYRRRPRRRDETVAVLDEWDAVAPVLEEGCEGDDQPLFPREGPSDEELEQWRREEEEAEFEEIYGSIPVLEEFATETADSLRLLLERPPEGVARWSQQFRKICRDRFRYWLRAYARCSLADPYRQGDQERQELIRQQGHAPITDPEQLIEAACWARSHVDGNPGWYDVDVAAEVYSVLQRIQQGRACAGKRALSTFLTERAMIALAHSLWNDHRRLANEARLKSLPQEDRYLADRRKEAEEIGYTRRYSAYKEQFVPRSRVGGTRYFAQERANAVDLFHAMDSLLPRAQLAEGQEELTPEQRDVNRKSDRTRKAQERLIHCFEYETKTVTNYGQSTEWNRTRCETDACGCCTAHRIQSEELIATEKWLKLTRLKPITWSDIYVMSVVVDDFDQVARIKKDVSRSRRPRLFCMGVTREGLIRCSWISAYRQGIGAAVKDENFRIWQRTVPNTRHLRAVFTKALCVEEAVDYVLAERVSYHAFKRYLASMEQNHALAAHWLREASGKQVVVSRHKEGPPWASKKEIKELTQSGETLTLAEGEVPTHLVRHGETKKQVLASEYPVALNAQIHAGKIHPTVLQWDMDQYQNSKTKAYTRLSRYSSQEVHDDPVDMILERGPPD